jgi:hypothetical protein
MDDQVVDVASLKHMGLEDTSAFIEDLPSVNWAIADALKAAVAWLHDLFNDITYIDGDSRILRRGIRRMLGLGITF